MEKIRKISKEEKERRGCIYCSFAKIKMSISKTKREYQYCAGCTVEKCLCPEFDTLSFEDWYAENFPE